MSDLRALQRDITAWHIDRYPDATMLHVAAKLSEETGEVVGAVLKQARPAWTERDILEEIGDVGIVLMRLCAFLGHDFEDVVIARWVSDVSTRNLVDA